MLYDSLLVLAIWMVSLFPLVMISHHAVSGPGVRSLLFIELYAFFAYFWTHGGRTLGMMAWRLRLDSNQGGPVTLAQATLRFLGALASFACLGLGYVWILFDPVRRSWSDLASSSHVIYVPSPPD